MKENQKEEDKKKGTKPQKESPLNSYLRYSAIAFQMGAIIGGGVWLGYWLDGKYSENTPWFTIGIGICSIFVALYVSLKDFFKPQ